MAAALFMYVKEMSGMDELLVFLFAAIMFVLLMLSICVPLNYMANQTLEWAREIAERNGNPPKSDHVMMTEVTGDLIAPVAASNTVMAPIIGSCAPTLTASEAVAGAAKALEGFGDG